MIFSSFFKAVQALMKGLAEQSGSAGSLLAFGAQFQRGPSPSAPLPSPFCARFRQKHNNHTGRRLHLLPAPSRHVGLMALKPAPQPRTTTQPTCRGCRFQTHSLHTLVSASISCQKPKIKAT